jgi:hypothetical protein
MGYETVLSAINTTQTKNFILSEKSFVLKEVSVKAAPILQKGDTTLYGEFIFKRARPKHW